MEVLINMPKKEKKAALVNEVQTNGVMVSRLQNFTVMNGKKYTGSSYDLHRDPI
jgi:hypothetical protein